MKTYTILRRPADGSRQSVPAHKVDECLWLPDAGAAMQGQVCYDDAALYVRLSVREQSIRAIALHTSSRMFGLIRFYYGHGYFIYSTESSRGYIRALLVHELEMPGQYDLEPVMAR